MGNKILQGYDVGRDPICESTELRWKLLEASVKDKDDKLTIFLFEKKNLDRQMRKRRLQFYEILRQDAMALQKLRHPCILQIVDPIMEERASLAFSTKHVVSTLHELISKRQVDYLEAKSGISSLVEALAFLHHDAKMAHLSVSPFTIFLTPQGGWLLGGFANAKQCSVDETLENTILFGDAYTQNTVYQFDPPVTYVAPEMTETYPGSVSQKCDVFSLGLVVLHAVAGVQIFEGVRDRVSHRQRVISKFPVSDSVIQKVPSDLRQILPLLLEVKPTARIAVSSFQQSDFFQDLFIRALKFLETLNEKDDGQRSQFLKGLQQLITCEDSPLYSAVIAREKLLPQLAKSLKFIQTSEPTLKNIFICLDIEKATDSDHFTRRIWPYLKPLFVSPKVPLESVLLVVEELHRLLVLIPESESNSTLVPFILKCLELNEVTIHDRVLLQLPIFQKRFGFRQMKDSILPRLLTLGSTMQNQRIRISIVENIRKMLRSFDQHTVEEVILPGVDKIKKADQSPEISKLVIELIVEAGVFLGTESICQRVIPLLSPYLSEASMSRDNYILVKDKIESLLVQVDEKRTQDFRNQATQQTEVGLALGFAAPKLAIESGLDFLNLPPAKEKVQASPKIPNEEDPFGFLQSLPHQDNFDFLSQTVVKQEDPFEGLL